MFALQLWVWLCVWLLVRVMRKSTEQFRGLLSIRLEPKRRIDSVNLRRYLKTKKVEVGLRPLYPSLPLLDSLLLLRWRSASQRPKPWFRGVFASR